MLADQDFATTLLSRGSMRHGQHADGFAAARRTDHIPQGRIPPRSLEALTAAPYTAFSVSSRARRRTGATAQLQDHGIEWLS